MGDSLISDLTNPASLIGYGLAAMTLLFNWLGGQRKSDIDESTVVLNKWKELVDSHQSDIKSLKEDFAAYRKISQEELEMVRRRLVLAEDRISVLEDENRTLRIENEGLVRQQAQASMSTLRMLAPNVKANTPASTIKFSDPDDDLVSQLKDY